MRASAVFLFLLAVAGVTVPAQAPLPDEAAFFAEARARLASNPDLRARYAYRERRTEMQFNPFGRIGPGPVEVYEVFPGPTRALTYRRLVERGGVPVPAREIAEQDREHLAEIHGHERARTGERASARAEREARDRQRRAEAQAQADEVIALFDFRIAGRERLEGEPAIVVTFAAKPGARPRSREARLAAAFRGRAWVHEHEYELLRIEAEATEDVSFGFGVIGRLHEGATATLVRRRALDTWLPVESRFEGTGRALLLRRVEFTSVYEYSDYRHFDPTRLAAMLSGGDLSARPSGW